MMSVVQRELLASCWTWAGDTGPGEADPRSPVPLRERLDAVVGSGWSGVGFSHADLVHFRDTVGLPAVRGGLDAAGVTHVELEILTGWWSTGEARRRSDRARSDFLDAAATLGASTIKVSAWQEWRNGPDRPDPRRFADEFASLAEDACSFGVQVALEPMSDSNLGTLRDAVDLVTAVGHPNGGLTIDCCQLLKSGDTDFTVLPSLLTGVPVFLVELADAPVETDGTLGPRCLPGNGDVRLAEFVAQMWLAGWCGPWGAEIISDALRRLPVAEGLATVADGVRSVLDDADRLLRARPALQ